MGAGMRDELEAREHLAVLTEASAALTGAGLDTPVVLDTITDLLVEHVGDSAIVFLLATNGVDFEVGSVTSRNARLAPVTQRIEMASRHRIDDGGLLARCAREQVPLLFPHVDLGALDPPLPAGYRDHVDETTLRSLAYVPLVHADETLGVLVVTRILDHVEPIDDADLDLVCDLGELATRSLLNTRLHRDLATSTALFETAFRAAPIGMALVSTTDDPGRIVRVNASMTKVTGYTEDELLAMRVPALFPADVERRIEADLRAAASGELTTAGTVGRLVTRDGTEVMARVDARGVQVPSRPAHIGLLQIQVPPAPLERQPGRMSPGGGGSGV